jgi:hypothetical protein
VRPLSVASSAGLRDSFVEIFIDFSRIAGLSSPQR